MTIRRLILKTIIRSNMGVPFRLTHFPSYYYSGAGRPRQRQRRRRHPSPPIGRLCRCPGYEDLTTFGLDHHNHHRNLSLLSILLAPASALFTRSQTFVGLNEDEWWSEVEENLPSTSSSPTPPPPPTHLSVPLVDSNANNTLNSSSSSSTSSGRVLLEDVFECLSKGREAYRLVLTPSHLLLHNAKDPSKMERYAVEDIFGCHTLRHKKQGQVSAYICFYLYPKSKKKGLLSSIKYRERVILVFEVKKGGYSFEQNLNVATLWKNGTLGILAIKYPKWQLLKSKNEGGEDDEVDQPNNNEEENKGGVDISKIIESQDVMDQKIRSGEPTLPLVSYLPFLRRFLIILNPKSGQGKGIEIFQDKVAPTLREAGVKMELQVTQHPGHARNMISSADLSEIDGIITIGGDGILYEVVNGLRTRGDASRVSNIPIGVIAGGSGNGLARSLAEYSGEADDYLRNPVLSTTLASARGKVIPVNLAEIDLDGKKIYSFLSMGWGLLADIDVESEFLRALGESRFTLYSFYRLAKLRSYKAKLSYIPATSPSSADILNGNSVVTTMKDDNSNDPVVIDGDFVCIYATYQSYIGSDLAFAPNAAPNDGLIHLVYMEGDIGRARATQFLISIDKGSHLEVEGVKYVTVKEFTIERSGGIEGNPTIDGEKVAGERIHVKLSPNPLVMFSL